MGLLIAVLALAGIFGTVGYLGYNDVATANEGAAISNAIRAGKVVVLTAVVGGGVYVMPTSTDVSGPEHDARLERIAGDLEDLGVEVRPGAGLTPEQVLEQGAVEAPSTQVLQLKRELEERGYSVHVIEDADSPDAIRDAWAAPDAVPQVDMPLMSDAYDARKVSRGTADSPLDSAQQSRGVVGLFGEVSR